MPRYINKAAINFCTLMGAGFCVLFVLYGLQHRLFTSQEALQSFMGGFGAFGAAVFVLFQAVQVIVPILPGGLGCLAGVLLFGPWMGFLYNYVGICLGSMAAFFLAKLYGRPILSLLFRRETIEKYELWTGTHFSKWFALAIFFPVAPDDFLCWLAGTTPMSWRTFNTIIWFGKPASIALYSLGLSAAFQWLSAIV
ncbi:TVP38/TMEM64 family protein [Oscillibacter sp. PC13]|uniref:TVP38/TMEM64 family protein n=1 Tax=Oscillibacter sp. PC13 TaxID=1855299 RepID=UPI000A4C0F23|nr:TVP38/TMEM64 family protein [Oscillibacter sp. PC13]